MSLDEINYIKDSNKWDCKPIKDLAEVYIGKTPPRKEHEWFSEDEGIKWVSIKDLGNCGLFIEDTSEYLTSDAVSKFNVKIAPKGTVLLSFKLTVGRVAITAEDMVTNEAIAQFIIKDNSILSKLYLYYYLKHFNYNSLGSTSSIAKAINSKIVREIPILLPPIEIQNKISNILYQLDSKIDNLNNINKNLLQLSKVIFKNWFVDFEPFGGVQPKDWRISTLEEVCDLNAGGDKPEIVSDEITDSCIYPIYSNGLDNNGLYGYTNHAKIFEECVTVSARGTIGFVCLRHTPYVPIVRLVSVIPKKEFISAKYLYLFLDRLNIMGTGTTQQQLTIPDFKKTEILVPTFDIIESFTNHLNPIFEKIWIQEEEIKKLSKLRDILLPKLMSGEIDVSKINYDI